MQSRSGEDEPVSAGLVLRALDPRRHWLYPLVYAGTALVLLLLLSLSASHSGERPEPRVVFVNGSAAAGLRDAVAGEDGAYRSGLDMAPTLSLPAAQPEEPAPMPPEPAFSQEPAPDSLPPPSDAAPDWAAPDTPAADPAPAERGEAGSSAGRRALTPLDPPKGAASQASSGAVLSLGKTGERPRRASVADAAPWPAAAQARKYRDLVGRMYGQ